MAVGARWGVGRGEWLRHRDVGRRGKRRWCATAMGEWLGCGSWCGRCCKCRSACRALISWICLCFPWNWIWSSCCCAASTVVLALLSFLLSKPWPLAGTSIITCTLTVPQGGCHPTQPVLVFGGWVPAEAATVYGPGGQQGGAWAQLLRHREPQWCGVWTWGSLH